VVDFVAICNVCVRKAIIEAAKRIINSDKVCHSYSDLNFGITFLEHSVYSKKPCTRFHQNCQSFIHVYYKKYFDLFSLDTLYIRIYFIINDCHKALHKTERQRN